MTIEAMFGGKCQCCTWAAIVIFGAALFAEVIINAIWFSKYHPWMSKAGSPVKYVYACTIVCTIFSILILILLIIMIICYFTNPTCSKNHCACISLCIFITLFTVVSVITGFGAGVYGMAGIQSEQNLFGKCYDHIIDQICGNVLDGVLSETHVGGYDKLEKYVSWIIDLLYSIVVFKGEKIPKEKYKENNVKRWVNEIVVGTALQSPNEILLGQITLFIVTYGNDYLNNNLCASLYVPEILFLVVEVIGFVWFLFTICCGCCCGRKSNNDVVTGNIQSSSLL